jgi:hypothetical protein
MNSRPECSIVPAVIYEPRTVRIATRPKHYLKNRHYNVRKCVKKTIVRHRCYGVDYRSRPKFWTSLTREQSIWTSRIKHAMVRAVNKFMKRRELIGKATSVGIQQISLQVMDRRFAPYSKQKILQKTYNIQQFHFPKMSYQYQHGAGMICLKCINLGGTGFGCLSIQNRSLDVTKKAYKMVATERAIDDSENRTQKEVRPYFKVARKVRM